MSLQQPPGARAETDVWTNFDRFVTLSGRCLAPVRQPGPERPVAGAKAALAILLAINLFNYIDRQVLSAVLPRLQLDGTIISPTDPDPNGPYKGP